MSNQTHNALRGLGRSMGWMPWYGWAGVAVVLIAVTLYVLNRRGADR